MSPKSYTPEEVEAARLIFIRFALRALGLSSSEAIFEFGIMMNVTGVPKTLDEYIRTNRAGAYFCLTRAERRSLYMSFENACNHATFDKA